MIRTREEGKRRCSICREIKLFEDFYSDSADTIGLARRCKECASDEGRKQRASWTPEKKRAKFEQQKDRRLRKTYGISLAEARKIHIDQDYKCAICYTTVEDSKMHVDHCHESNMVRGILCINCNLLIGLAKDSDIILTRAIQYLKEANDKATK